ncbi:hypothetical protein QL285_039602 [Trifolium repens]|nr:hypothetical protein QL285_039602 [Trifolium repens]
MSDHLSWSPFPKGYTTWLHHGEIIRKTSTISPSIIPNIGQEAVVVEDPIHNMIHDAFGVDRDSISEVPVASGVEIDLDEDVMPSETQERGEAKEFYELTREGEQPLYEGCKKYSRLSFLVKLYHIKCLCGLSDKSMTMILELLKDAFEFANIPSSFYEAKKTITKLGLNYVKIPACPNNCMLYWGEDEERETCKKCNTSKWKSNAKGGNGNTRKKVPAKILRYFPLKPRLQRLFLSSKTAEDMRWHAVDTNNDNVNGFKFRTLARDILLKTQNSGVFGMFGTRSYSSNSDAQMRYGGVPYYGRLISIIELCYDGFTVPMFKCEWANTTNPRGIKTDKLGFSSINFARVIHAGENEDDEPFIKASEAQMVFYVDDEKDQGWSIPVHLKPRDLYDMGGDDETMAPIEPYPSQNLDQIFSNDTSYTISKNDYR